jgi:hypothetical protein
MKYWFYIIVSLYHAYRISVVICTEYCVVLRRGKRKLITNSMQGESIIMDSGQRLPTPSVTEAYVLLNGTQLGQGPLIPPTNYLAFSSLVASTHSE